MREKDELLILHRNEWKESSFILKTFSREHGLLSLMAKGAKRPKSSFRGRLEVGSFLIGQWIPGRNSDLGTLTEVTLGSQTVAMIADLKINALQLVLLETIQKLQPIAYQDQELFDLLKSTWKWLAQRADEKGDLPRNFLSKFWCKVMELHGLGLRKEHCIRCSSPLENRVRFVPRHAGFLCSQCELPIEFHEWLLRKKSSGTKEWYDLEELVLKYLDAHLPGGCSLKSYSYWKQVRDWGASC